MKLPTWEDAIEGIDDSRFTTKPDRWAVQIGARIMYDRLLSMADKDIPESELLMRLKELMLDVKIMSDQYQCGVTPNSYDLAEKFLNKED